MKRFVFPTSNGIVVHASDKKVFSAINCEGQKKLQSFPEKNKIIFWHFPFMRGFQYFFCGVVALYSAMFLSYDLCGKQKIKSEDLKKYYITNLAIFILVMVFGVIFAGVVLGYFPGKLGWICVGVDGNQFLRNLVILSFKLLFFFILILMLRVFPVVNDFFRFNRAGDVALFLNEFGKVKKKKTPPNALNFLNYLVFVFVLDFIVITLVGASFGFWFNIFFHLAIFLGCTSVAFETLKLVNRCPFFRWLAFITAIFVYSKPSVTHIETASIALTESNLLATQKGREFMSNENIAFSVVYNEVKNKLAVAGISDKSETDWLIATVLGKNRAEIKLLSTLTDKQQQDIMKATVRRTKGESLDNIFGFTEFYALRFDVNKKVLTPRMETEILVEHVLKSMKEFKSCKVLDVGTGSGAIAVAIAKNSEADVTAIDISKSALATAELNAKKNDVKIEFIHSNLFENLKRKRKFDIIVSNPPYIPTDDIKKLDKNVRECDPIIALDGGEDGLDYYRKIVPLATKRLLTGGMLFFEIGKGQGPAVRKIMRDHGFDVKTIKDYNKIERVICGKLR